jgi:transcriptional regulator with XRE-family HTH domain
MSPHSSEPDLIEIGHRLRRLRMALGRNQREMAEVAGMPPPVWNGCEKGTRPLQVYQALRLAAMFGASLDWIYRGDIAMMPQYLMGKIQEIERVEAINGPRPEKRIRRRSV